jgi:uncharacterized protein
MSALALLGYLAVAFGLQLLLAVALAVWRNGHSAVAQASAPASPRLVQAAWEGLRDFRIAERTYEDLAQTQCSFALVPVDDAPLPPFKPGQFLTLSLAVDGPEASARVVRCYSMSDTPDPAQYRITVKRALAPAAKPDVDDGVASGWLLDEANLGLILNVRAPSGQFVFSPDAKARAVFIAGGIGITPILSMLKSALPDRPDTPVQLFYGLRSGQDHAFKAALSTLASEHPSLDMHVLYAEPGAADVLGRDYDQAGFITLDLLKQTLRHGRHAFYICGPDPMMKALIPALLDWGVDNADIHRESFGPQTAVPTPLAPTIVGPVFPIGFRRSGRTIDWTGQDANLLDFAERQSVEVDTGCRNGTCGICETRLISGSVLYAVKPEFDIAPGHCLLCVGTPATALELDA